MIPKKNCLDHKMKPFMSVLLVFLVMIPFILTACSSRSSNEGKKKGRPYHKGYIKLYEWKEFPQNNLSAVLKDDRQILEIKANKGQTKAFFSIDFLRDGKMEEGASSEMTLDDQELNYLNLSYDQLDEGDRISVCLNGEKVTLTVPPYFQNATERRVSLLGNQRALKSMNYLMYIVDSGEAIDLERVYGGDTTMKGTGLIAIKMEVR